MDNIGKKSWIIPDMYWPEITSKGHYVSHESICVLNVSDKISNVVITLYYEDRQPLKGLIAKCDPERTHHIRMDMILDTEGRHIPRGIPYSAVVQSDVAIVVQYTRVDTTQSENAIMTTLGF